MRARHVIDGLFEAEVQGELSLSAPEPTPAPPPADEKPEHHVSYYNSKRAMAILPIGVVNLMTGKNALFGNVFDGWEEDPNATNLLVVDTNKKVMAVHSSGSMGFKPGMMMRFRHDQNGRIIGNLWELLGSFPHTKDGLRQMAQKAGKNSLVMATFK